VKIGRLDAEVHGARLVLAGRIDDAAGALGELIGHLPAGDVVIDTSGVTFVKLDRMREWMRLVRALRGRGGHVRARRRRADDPDEPDPGVQGRRDRIVHAQYVCPSCGNEATPLLDVATHGAQLRQMTAPKLPCPECGSAMDLGDFPERYLSLFRA